MINFTLLPAAVILLLFVPVFITKLRAKEKPKSIIAYCLLALYAVFFVGFCFFPIVYDRSLMPEGEVISSNVIPMASMLRQLRNSPPDEAFMSVGGAVLIFIPVGLLVPVAFNKLRAMSRTMFFSFVLSLFTEIAGGVMGIFGLYSHMFDVDNIILNLLGGTLGYCGFLMLGELAPKLRQRRRSKLS
jgi:glycopeptide antibiotics resistance protein